MRFDGVHVFGYITPPEVNRFGRHFEHSENIVGRWPWQILDAIRGEAIARKRGEILFSFVRCATHDFTDFRSAKFHDIYIEDVDL